MHEGDKKGQMKEQKACKERREINRRGESQINKWSGKKKQKKKAKYRDVIGRKEETVKKNKGIGGKAGIIPDLKIILRK